MYEEHSHARDSRTAFRCIQLAGQRRHAQDPQSCQPGLSVAVATNVQVYSTLVNALVPSLQTLANDLNAVVDQATYATLLMDSRNLAATVVNGRVVITLPDGTVVVDTARTDDPNNTLAVGNSYAHYIAKTVNENHNSRVAIFAAQEYPCGVGVERKFSSSTGTTETYLAVRLGTHLDSIGTARLSTR